MFGWQVYRLCVRMEEMKLEVNCYSGRTAGERPVRFRLEGHEYMVDEVLDQWYGPQDTFLQSLGFILHVIPLLQR